MRAPFFPRSATPWHLLEPSGWRSVSLSALEMGAITGIVLRAFRALALTHGASDDGSVGLLYLAVTYGAGILLLCGMLALHLANFPVRRWPWRVLGFALAEAAAEMATSAALIAVGREPLGSTGRAHWHDLPSMAARTLLARLVALAAFAAVLAAVVQLVRVALARRRPPALPALPGVPHDP